MRRQIAIAGVGGQGIQLIGKLLCYAGARKGFNVTHIPSYGAEMRGGDTKCSVNIADEDIPDPVVHFPEYAIFISTPGLRMYLDKLVENGVAVYNSSLIPKEEIKRQNINAVGVPASDIAANELKNPRATNMVTLGGFLGIFDMIDLQITIDALADVMTGTKKRLIEGNKQALELGYGYVKNNLKIKI